MPRKPENKLVTLEHAGVVADVPRARAYLIGGRKVWLSKALVTGENSRTVSVPAWRAESLRLAED